MADINYEELEDLTLTMEDEDGTTTECELQFVFEYDGQDYGAFCEAENETGEFYFFSIDGETNAKGETELEIDVPENWEGSYYPTFLPEGYMLQFSESDKGKNEAEYTDVQGETLRITECNITVINRINTENAEVSHVKVHGVNATVLKQPYGEIDIIWANGDRYFIVSSNDYDTALAVAESMKLVQKK